MLIKIKYLKKRSLFLSFDIFFITLFAVFIFITPRHANAQTSGISLSVNPPLIEVMAKPGKSFEERYIIKNDGAPTSVKVNIAPFTASDSLGNVNLGENLSDFDPQSFSSWFSFSKPRMKYGGKIFISTGESREVILKITPPEDASEGDYYFTITFETDYGDEVVAGNAISKVKIGSNILLTISENATPTKKAKVVSFYAPKIIDGLLPITYNVEIENIGSTLFKPIGKIMVKDMLGRVEVLNLAPQNILASSKRIINCIDGEKIVSCTLNNRSKIPFGIYRATLIFNAEGGDKIYKEEAVTLVLPTTIIIAFIVSFVIIVKILRKTNKKRGSDIKNDEERYSDIQSQV